MTQAGISYCDCLLCANYIECSISNLDSYKEERTQPYYDTPMEFDKVRIFNIEITNSDYDTNSVVKILEEYLICEEKGGLLIKSNREHISVDFTNLLFKELFKSQISEEIKKGALFKYREKINKTGDNCSYCDSCASYLKLAIENFSLLEETNIFSS